MKADGAAAPAYRYSAFISYNHRDRKTAAWLHRALETYRIPKHIQGREGALGTIGPRLPPLFQDRQELATSNDLAGSVREALEASATLIVICSPNSAKSRWVNEEIRAFAAMGRRDRIKCLIISGVSHTASKGMDPDLECLPPALFEDAASEPLAADIRPGSDDRTAAKLKLLAGILGVGYDELRQREQARRQRQLVGVASVSAVGFLLMSGLAGFALVSREEAVRQRDIARQKTLTAERTVTFVKSLFEVADPSESRGQTITAREILDRGAARIDAGLETEPNVRAELGTTLGEVYTNLGLFSDGEALVQRMLAIPQVDAGTRARQLQILGEAKSWQADDAAAVDAFQKALALARDPRAGRPDLAPRILRWMSMSQSYLGKTAEGEANAKEALRLDRARRSPEPEIAHDLEALGANYLLTNRFGEARRVLNQALEIRVRLQGEDHPRAISDLNSLGYAAYMEADAPTAERFWRRTLAVKEKVFGPKHPQVAVALNNVALVMVERRAYAPAEPMLRRALDINLAQRDPATSELVFIYTNLGLARRGLGDVRAGATAFEQGLVAARKHKHRNLAPLLVNLADVDCERGALAQGLARLDEAAPAMAATYPKDPWRSGWVDVVRAGCLLKAGREDAARRALAGAAPKVQARWPASSHYGFRTAQLLKAAS